MCHELKNGTEKLNMKMNHLSRCLKGQWLSFRLCNFKQKHSETECKNTVCTFFSIFTLSSLE